MRLNWKTLEKLVMSLRSDLLGLELKVTDFVLMRLLATPLELELGKHSGKLTRVLPPNPILLAVLWVRVCFDTNRLVKTSLLLLTNLKTPHQLLPHSYKCPLGYPLTV